MRRLAGSFFAVAVGWLTGFLALGALHLSTVSRDSSGSFPWGRATELEILAASMWVFIAPVWLLAFLPLYSLIPRSSTLWHWPQSTVLGALVGAAVMYGLGLFEGSGQIHDKRGTAYLASIAAIVGGVASLTASLTAHRFLDV